MFPVNQAVAEGNLYAAINRHQKKIKAKFDVHLIIFNPTFKTFKAIACQILNMPVLKSTGNYALILRNLRKSHAVQQ
jgi:hypothetical protein